MAIFAQYLLKVILSVIVVLIAGFTLRTLWNTSIDMRKLANPMRWFESTASQTWSFLPSRDPHVLYFDGKPIAKVREATIDKKTRTIYFKQVSGPNGFYVTPDGKLRQIEFRDYVITHRRSEGSGSFGQDTFDTAEFNIVGRRSGW